MLVCLFWASAPAYGEDEFTHQAATVRTLIQAETTNLLQALREPGQATASASHGGQASQTLDQPRLVAIYGVGKALRATVQWRGQRLEYRQGQADLPPLTSQQWQLQSLSGRCIVLRQESLRHRTCLGR